jgi:hypothetical protein
MAARLRPWRLAPLLLLTMGAAPVLASHPAGPLAHDPVGDAAVGEPDLVAATARIIDGRLDIVLELAASPPITWEDDAGYTDTITIFGAAGDRGDVLELKDATFVVAVYAAGLDAGGVLTVAGPDGSPGTPLPGAVEITVAESTVSLSLPAAGLGDPARIGLVITARREGPGSSPRSGDRLPDMGSMPVTTVRSSANLAGWWADAAAVVPALALAGVLAALIATRLPALRLRHRGPGSQPLSR